ncbi:MAG: ComF family protein [Lachnospiraceae bacterium]|nr:ComF family protein [Lachnospiraceae bacterium]
MGKNKRTIIDYIYPPRCPICDDILEEGKNIPCLRCRHHIRYITSPRCMKCGKQIEDEYTEYCYDCLKTKHYYTKGIAVWSYQDCIKQSIYNFKYNNKRENSKFYINEILRIYEKQIRQWKADVIIPIPLHRIRERRRGYNQARLIADGISRQLEIPVNNNILIRTINTRPQKELNDKERIKNLAGAFALTDTFKKSQTSHNIKKAILIDDIYTTGATMDICAKLLRESGFEEIYYICVCTGKGY